MIRITEIIDKVYDYNPDADVHLIDQAYIYAAKAHKDHVRLSGEPYLSHPLEVANILVDMKMDVESIAAALLHDVIEDTPATKEDLEKLFGPGVAHIVEGVTKLSKLPTSTKIVRQAESLRKMILAMADDIRVILIKLADRLHNMRTLHYHPKEEKKAAIAQETLDIYAPIAARLGIFRIKYELEDIGFYNTQRDEYERIEALVKKARQEKDTYITKVKYLLEEKMKEMELPCTIKGRFKQHYSIYQKMLTQNLKFNQVYDIIAFRIILDSVPQCYAAMGAVHSMFKPIDYKIKDYIAKPKPNMYQSIHTTVIGPMGERMEIQIRTKEMDRTAESGIAAHWSYKAGQCIDKDTSRVYAWIRTLVENQEASHDPDEFLENVRIDLSPGEIHLFTPQGDIKTLPKDATPVDFAYAVHTEVGSACTGAIVNDEMVPLSHTLKNGDVIKVMTTKGHTPSPDWLNFVKTVKARTKIRSWIKIRERERAISLGRVMCEKAFRKKSLNFKEIANTDKIMEAANAFGLKTTDDLIANVGFLKITPLQIIHKIFPEETPANEESDLLEKFNDSNSPKNESGIEVEGLDDILVKFSKCCNPLPGDAITGYITRGQGVAIHRKNCLNMLKISPERLIDVQWHTRKSDRFRTGIKIQAQDRSGLLADITSTITKSQSNILGANTETSEEGIASFRFTITVEDSEQLARVITNVKKIKNVTRVKRIVR